jgi:hypothetical protein
MRVMNASLKVCIGVFVHIFTLLFLLSCDRSTSSAVKNLPSDAKVVGVYSSFPKGNGDYIYAFKASIDRVKFIEFCKKSGLSSDPVDPYRVIGYNRSADDIDARLDWEWDEPDQPQLKFFVFRERHFIRAVFHGGYIYYYSRGW